MEPDLSHITPNVDLKRSRILVTTLQMKNLKWSQILVTSVQMKTANGAESTVLQIRESRCGEPPIGTSLHQNLPVGRTHMHEAIAKATPVSPKLGCSKASTIHRNLGRSKVGLDIHADSTQSLKAR